MTSDNKVSGRTSGGQKRPGILDVADKAGVSRQTVTRAMNDMPGISVETKSRVLEAARELQYRPSRFGRGLVKQDLNTLGLVVVDLMNPYFAELASKMISVAYDEGWTVLVQEIARDRQREKGILASLAQQVDAIVGYIIVDDDRLDDLVGTLPLVSVTDGRRPGRRPWVSVDNVPGMTAALDLLVEGGHRNLVMIDYPNEFGPSPRARVLRDLCAQRSLALRTIEISNNEEPDAVSAAQAVEEAVSADPSIDAIIGFNDIAAVGALKALANVGRSVPEQCAVIGIDGLPLGELVSPELTTLRLNMDDFARTLFNAVITATHAVPGAHYEKPIAVASHSLTVRQSTRPVA